MPGADRLAAWAARLLQMCDAFQELFAGITRFHAFVFGDGTLHATRVWAGMRLLETRERLCTLLFKKAPVSLQALFAWHGTSTHSGDRNTEENEKYVRTGRPPVFTPGCHLESHCSDKVRAETIVSAEANLVARAAAGLLQVCDAFQDLLAGGAGFHAFVFGGGFLLVTPAGAGIRLLEIGKGACTLPFEKTPAEIKALSARQHFFEFVGICGRLEAAVRGFVPMQPTRKAMSVFGG